MPGLAHLKKIRILLKVGGSEISTIWFKKLNHRIAGKFTQSFLFEL